MPSRPRPDKPEEVIFRLLERIDRLETMVYGRNSSVTNGRTRFVGNESLLVQGSQKVEGWLVVTGTERVTGTLEVLGRLVASGAIDLTGPTSITGDTELTGTTTITGPANVTGDLTVDGNWSLDGDGKITGNVELTGDMKTQDGGRVVVTGDAGDTTLTNSKMSFANGSELAAYGNGGAAITSPDLILISGQGGIGMQGLDQVPASAAGMPVNALGITPLGRVFRVVAG